VKKHFIMNNKLVFLATIGLSLAIQVRAETREVLPGTDAESVNKILNAAEAGDTVLFREGSHTGPFMLNRINGAPDMPVVITGEGPGLTIIDGKAEPATGVDHQAFVMEDCSWIQIEQLTIRNCWTDLVVAHNSSYISLRSCSLEGGKRALFAKGRGSHHFLVEQCTWEQDERVWTHEGDYSWDEIHHGIHAHYNGSIFLGSEISGVFVLRDNTIRNIFNAFRLSNIADRESDPLACTNGEIYRNTIYNSSDNVLEPEVHARNLHYYHNRMINGHAFVSITEVQGGDIYIYGNTAVSLPESEDGWTIFKISSRRDSLTRPLYIYNNSWQVDFDMVGSPRNVWENSHVIHFNNACYSEASDTFGIYNLGIGNSFDYDCSNVPFPVLLTGNGHEKNGIVADPGFTDPYANNFHLEKGSPCIDRGTYDPQLIFSYQGDAPDIGAYDNGRLVEGPPFRHVQPDAELPYRERPRIVRHQWKGMTFKLWFSAPLTKASVDGLKAHVAGSGDPYPLGPPDLSEDGYCLTFATRPMERPRTRQEAGRASRSSKDPGHQNRMSASPTLVLNKWPEGHNGMPATSWAATLPVTVNKTTDQP